MTRFALTFTVRPESASSVAGLLRSYPRPQCQVDDRTRILAIAFMLRPDENRVVQYMRVEGEVTRALEHLAADPAIREIDRALNPHLTHPRDLEHPSGTQAFFQRTMMRCVADIVSPSEMLPTNEPWHLFSVLYPIPPGGGDYCESLLRPPQGDDALENLDMKRPHPRINEETSMVSTTVFRLGDVIVRTNEYTGSLDLVKRHVAESAEGDSYMARLSTAFPPEYNVDTAAGFQKFLDNREFSMLSYYEGTGR